jgi:hypothetical protein
MTIRLTGARGRVGATVLGGLLSAGAALRASRRNPAVHAGDFR